MNHAKSLWFEEAGKAVFREDELPDLRKGWCCIDTSYSAISPGTERLVFLGDVPNDLFSQMKTAYMGGDFAFPLKYGYSLVGRIIDGSFERIGQTVHILHPHQNRCVVREEDAFPVPDDIPSKRATLASNMETAVNAVWDSGLTIGERALVVGFGIVGSLVARLLSFFPGVEVTITDNNPLKLSLAEKMEFDVQSPDNKSNAFDVAFHASGDPNGLQSAIDSVGFEGRVVELSWYGKKEVSLNLGGSFHSMRKKILSSQVSSIPPQFRSKWDFNKRKSLVFEFLARDVFDTHITHSYPFDDLVRVFDDLKTPPTEGLSYLVVY
jgi:2-desacetyl-2-hydroxyethyl bacteriochlorophyllide A dehydrogenase